jgi:hypothetical protein
LNAKVGLNHVFSDGIGIGRIEAEQYKMVVDALG